MSAGPVLVAVRRALAPAKLNLHLLVLGRRADGYHELESVFELIDLFDELDFTRRDDGLIERNTTQSYAVAEQDLAIRAARALQAASGTGFGVTIGLSKRIPVGGGLGGGSSDCATTLIVLNRLWQLNWPRAKLADIALSLGADVPFFLFGRCAYARGIGEKLRPVAASALNFVIAVPRAAVSTARVFAAPELTRDSKPLKISGSSRRPSASDYLIRGRNDLEPVVLASEPEVFNAYQALVQQLTRLAGRGNVVRMTGSGGCVFAAVADCALAHRLAAQVKLQLGGRLSDVLIARSLPSHPLLRWAER